MIVVPRSGFVHRNCDEDLVLKRNFFYFVSIKMYKILSKLDAIEQKLVAYRGPPGENLDDIADDFLRPFTPTPQPHAIMMVGLPGSGKSVTKEMFFLLKNADKRMYPTVDPDTFLEKYFENQTSEKNYAYCYKLQSKVIDKVIAKRLNILLDGTGKNLFPTIDKFKTANYKIDLLITLVDSNLAWTRTEQRGRLTGRTVDWEYFSQTNALINQNVNNYLESPDINDVMLVVNDFVDDDASTGVKVLCTKKAVCQRIKANVKLWRQQSQSRVS